jgi:microcompartment protein CcmL/EutN
MKNELLSDTDYEHTKDTAVLGVLEFNSIAVGIEAMDFMVKAAPVRIIDAQTICPGKFLILITGDVASVDASLSAGMRAGEGFLIDDLFLATLHPSIIPSIVGAVKCTIWDAVGVVESFSSTASIVAGDIAAKTAAVVITEIRLATGLGGKSYVKMVGSMHDVEASMEEAVKYVKGRGLLCKDVILSQPHSDIKQFFL